MGEKRRDKADLGLGGWATEMSNNRHAGLENQELGFGRVQNWDVC